MQWLLWVVAIVLFGCLPGGARGQAIEGRLSHPVHITASRLYVSELLDTWTQQTGVALSVNSRLSVSGYRVSVDLKGVPLDRAMQTLCAVLGEGYYWYRSSDSVPGYALLHREHIKGTTSTPEPKGIQLCDPSLLAAQIPPYLAVQAFREVRERDRTADPIERLSLLIPIARRVTAEQWDTLVTWESANGPALALLHPFLIRLSNNPHERQALLRGKTVPLDNLAAGLESHFPRLCQQVAAGEIVGLRASITTAQTITSAGSVTTSALALELSGPDGTVVRCETVSTNY